MYFFQFYFTDLFILIIIKWYQLSTGVSGSSIVKVKDFVFFIAFFQLKEGIRFSSTGVNFLSLISLFLISFKIKTNFLFCWMINKIKLLI